MHDRQETRPRNGTSALAACGTETVRNRSGVLFYGKLLINYLSSVSPEIYSKLHTEIRRTLKELIKL
jgi:hypothetical protein